MKVGENKHIVLIGAGNVATQMGIALHTAGYKILQVYSRKKASAATLAKKLSSSPVTQLAQLDKTAAIYIISVNDDAIEEVAAQLSLGDKIVVHTSGSAEMKVLKGSSKNYGVLYPLQSLSKNIKADFSKIPLCIEASNKTTGSSLLYFARSISTMVQEVSTEQRSILHLGAVFANNFSNHLFHISSRILAGHKLPFQLLEPLIEETFRKLKAGTPLEMQTGPAIRGDKKVMKKHLKLLSEEKEYRKIYELMSKSIAGTGKKNK